MDSQPVPLDLQEDSMDEDIQSPSAVANLILDAIEFSFVETGEENSTADEQGSHLFNKDINMMGDIDHAMETNFVTPLTCQDSENNGVLTEASGTAAEGAELEEQVGHVAYMTEAQETVPDSGMSSFTEEQSAGPQMTMDREKDNPYKVHVASLSDDVKISEALQDQHTADNMCNTEVQKAPLPDDTTEPLAQHSEVINTNLYTHTDDMMKESTITDFLPVDLAGDSMVSDVAVVGADTDLADDSVADDSVVVGADNDLADDNVANDIAVAGSATDRAGDRVADNTAVAGAATDLAGDNVADDAAIAGVASDLADDAVVVGAANDLLNTEKQEDAEEEVLDVTDMTDITEIGLCLGDAYPTGQGIQLDSDDQGTDNTGNLLELIKVNHTDSVEVEHTEVQANSAAVISGTGEETVEFDHINTEAVTHVPDGVRDNPAVTLTPEENPEIILDPPHPEMTPASESEVLLDMSDAEPPHRGDVLLDLVKDHPGQLTSESSTDDEMKDVEAESGSKPTLGEVQAVEDQTHPAVDTGQHEEVDTTKEDDLKEKDVMGPDDLVVTSIREAADSEQVDDEFDFDLPEPSQQTVTPEGQAKVEEKDQLAQLLQTEATTQAAEVIPTSVQTIEPAPVVLDPTAPAQIDVQMVNGMVDQSAISQEAQGPETAKLTTAKQEWDEVHEVVPELEDEDQKGGVHAAKIDSAALVAFSEALQHFQNADLSKYKAQIKPSVSRRGLAALSHLLFGPPKLHRDLVEEKHLIFSIAACPLINEDELHMRVLQTVYRRLTGSRFDCSRYGSHWEQIGFQGTDPATDLRGTGFLGLMHLLNLVTDPSMYPLARDIHKLSMDPVQNFPFCLMGINMSKHTLQLLREDCFNKECNKRKQVIGTTNDFYVGMYYHLYVIWKTQHKTIADAGFVIKEVETFARKNPKAILKNLEAHLLQRRQGQTGGVTMQAEKPAQFTNIDLDADED